MGDLLMFTLKGAVRTFNETGSKLNGTLKSLIKENILNRAYHKCIRFSLFSIRRTRYFRFDW